MASDPGTGGRKSRYFVLGSTTAPVRKEDVKSLFIRIGAPDGKQPKWAEGARLFALRFYAPFPALTPLPLAADRRLFPVAPLEVPARVSASSVLEPQAAYQPAHLFDSRYDFAWSTNGKKPGDAAAWVDVQWDAPLDIAGIVLWNGYQRSETHYKANGRPATITVTGSRGQSQDVTLKDGMEPQHLTFAHPFLGISTLRLTLGRIYKGTSYPDVLISEVRFITTRGEIVLPKVSLAKPPASARLEPFLDRTFGSNLCATGADIASTSYYSFKLRSNGSFTAYLNEEEDGEKKETVWEGNWEEQKDGLRLFGKRYSSFTGWKQIAYGLAEERTAAEIFQTPLKLMEFKSLSPAQQERLARLALKAHHVNLLETASALPALTKSLTAHGGVALESALFSDVLTPADAGLCHP